MKEKQVIITKMLLYTLLSASVCVYERPGVSELMIYN